MQFKNKNNPKINKQKNTQKIKITNINNQKYFS